MKKLLVLLALCMVLSVVMVACTTEETPTDETTAGEVTEAPTNAETEAPTETETEAPTETETEAPTETETEAPTETETETETETQKPADPVKVGMSFDQLYTGNGAATAGEENFFTPGQSASWDGKAVIEDYNVAYVTVWGWVAFFAETPGTFGYQIGDADPVFDAAFSIEAEQPVIDAALSQGGKSAARMHISIPVEYLSGEEIVIKALAKDAVGTIETLVEFKLTKPVNPNAPVFFVTAGEMASSIPGSPDVASANMSADGQYITITTGTVGDPYYQLPMINGKGYQAGFIAIKYRTTVEIGGQIFIGSGATPTGAGDNPTFDYVSDGKWNLVIIPLEGVASITEAGINYLRWDMFQRGTENSIDMAYIAAFNSAEAAQAYDAKVSGALVDTLNVDPTTWVISGHRNTLQDSTDGMVNAGGVEFGALLHQGAIYVGEINLAEMSQVVVYFGVDGSQATIDRYDANPANRIILSKVDTNGNMSPAEEDIIASITYTELGWAVHPVTIDLTGVDYNGPVYVTYDTLPGTFMLFSSIEFTYDKNYVEPEPPVEVPEHYDQAVVLGERDPAGAPYMGAGDKKMGQKLPLGENILKQITIKDLATYADGNTNTWSLKIWAWNTDYATTVAGTPLYEITGENHNDNATFVLDIPVELMITGDVYYELEYLSGSGGFTGWPAKAVLVEGVESYVAGNLKEGTFASSVVIGIPGEAPEAPEMIDKSACADFDKFSFDGFYLNDSLYFETDGQANVKLEAINNTVTISGVNTIGYRGWISFKSAPAAAFGYYIVDVTDGVVVGEFLQERPDLAGAGIVNGTGYKIDVPVADLAAGTYTTGMVAILADGTVVKLYEITLIVEEASVVEPLVVDMNTEANAARYDADGWPEAGITTPFFKLGYNNFLACGTLDLSKYSKAEIVYSFDGTVGITDLRVEAALSNAIGLKSEASAYGWFNNEPNFSGDLGHDDMEFSTGGWTGLRTAEIDLTAVDYNGEVWLAIYNPEGTEIVIHSLTLIP